MKQTVREFINEILDMDLLEFIIVVCLWFIFWNVGALAWVIFSDNLL
jgi:hypothetical protein